MSAGVREPRAPGGGDAPAATEILIGRQAIFDRDGRKAAYELLFRAKREHRDARIADGDAATLNVILNTFHEIGLPAIVGRLPAFINLTEGFLTGHHRLGIGPRQVVLEVLESVAIHADVIAALRALAADGYAIALDDFVYEHRYEELLEFVDYVKLDVKALSDEQLQAQLDVLRGRPLALVAEKIETAAMLAHCRALGFDLFQGYHLARPETIATIRRP